ncbi:threonine--tRNA ligase [Striga asiatica]|uniref:Threonine--tRNA ligase n=1 Tax=Striga asiatica TaxID=4170 RepID=A0A5A7PR48_STRAF|nr:threonine--tRNA ligase [Striga asiatica]
MDCAHRVRRFVRSTTIRLLLARFLARFFLPFGCRPSWLLVLLVVVVVVVLDSFFFGLVRSTSSNISGLTVDSEQTADTLLLLSSPGPTDSSLYGFFLPRDSNLVSTVSIGLGDRKVKLLPEGKIFSAPAVWLIPDDIRVAPLLLEELQDDRQPESIGQRSKSGSKIQSGQRIMSSSKSGLSSELVSILGWSGRGYCCPITS